MSEAESSDPVRVYKKYDHVRPFVDALVKKLKGAAALSLLLSLALSLRQPSIPEVNAALQALVLATCSAVDWASRGMAETATLALGALWRAPAYVSVLPLSLLGLYLHVQYWERARWRQGFCHLHLELHSAPTGIRRAARASGFLQWVLTPVAMASTVYFCDVRPLYVTVFSAIALFPGLALMRSMSIMASQLRLLDDATSLMTVYFLALAAGAVAGVCHGLTGLFGGAASMLVLCHLAKLPPCPVVLAQDAPLESCAEA